MSTHSQDGDGPSRAKDELERFYSALETSSSPARRVGWESDVGHRWRLGAIVAALAPVATVDSVLDAGCGEGRLLEVLHAAGFRGAYRGEELREVPLARARAATPPPDLRQPPEYRVAQAFGDGEGAEVVVCCGALNTREGPEPAAGAALDAPHERRVAQAVRALWRRTGHTLAVDLAILDRHAPGGGIGRVRMGFAVELFRGLGGFLRVIEDGMPGEALFVVARDRRRAIANALADPPDRLAALLEAGDAGAILWHLEQPGLASLPAPARALATGRALASRGDLLGAEAVLWPLAEGAANAAMEAHAPRSAVALALAPVLWRLGQRERAVALMRSAVAGATEPGPASECRFHLGRMLEVLGLSDQAKDVRASITDPWIRRALPEDA